MISLTSLTSRRTSCWSAFVTIPRCHLSLAYTLHEPLQCLQGSKEGKPLIILHGLFGSKQNHRSISKVLARDLQRPVYALDLRNHGESPHDSLHDYSSMADDVEEFIHHHKLEQPILTGHSMGAKVAMTVALRSSSLLGALIPVDNAPVDALLKSDFSRYLEGMREIEYTGVRKTAEADHILRKYEDALAIRQFLMTNLVKSPTSDLLRFRIPIQTLASSLVNMGDFPFRNPAAACYKGPTLFVRGTQSHYIADDVLPVIGQFFPRFIMHDIDCGHWVIAERPEAFKQAVVDFLGNR